MKSLIDMQVNSIGEGSYETDSGRTYSSMTSRMGDTD